jgi:hypothetical protein
MEEKRVSPSLFTETGNWVRFTRYEIVEVEGELYIKPAEDSNMEVYDPYEKSSFILLDLIKTAEKMDLNADNMERAKYILKFVNKYGLLGLYSVWSSSFPDKLRKIDIQIIKKRSELYDRLLKAKTLSESLEIKAEIDNFPDDFVRFVVLRQKNPFSRRLLQKFNSDREFFDYYEWEYDKFASIFFPLIKLPYPKHDDKDYLNFWRNYCEPVYAYIHLLLVDFRSVYLWTLDLEEFEKGNFTLDNYYGHDKHFRGKFNKQKWVEAPELCTTWRDMLSNTIFLDGTNINLTLDDDGSKKIGYVAISLYDQICLMFIQDRVSKNQVLKRCKNEKCNQWFIAKSPKAQYHSTSCGTNVRVDRFRKNKDNEKS